MRKDIEIHKFSQSKERTHFPAATPERDFRVLAQHLWELQGAITCDTTGNTLGVLQTI